jgi:magnesium chelatase family protein
MQKISGPLMDRIDIHIDVPAVNYKEMRSTSEPEGSAQIRERIVRAREIQLRRFDRAGAAWHEQNQSAACADRSIRATRVYSNAQMTQRHIRTFCELSADCERLLERTMNQQGLTARAMTAF